MNPALYELKRVLRSKFVIILFIIILIIPPLFSYFISEEAKVANDYSNILAGYYKKNGDLNLVIYSFNSYGNPNTNVKIQISIGGNNYVGRPESSGFLNISIPMNSQTVTNMHGVVVINYTEVSGTGEIFSNSYPLIIDSNYSGLNLWSPIINPSNTSSLGIIGLYIGPNDSLSPPLHIEVYAVNNTTFSPLNFNNVSKQLELSAYYNLSRIIKIYPESSYEYLSKAQAVLVFNNTSGIQLPISGTNTPAVYYFSSLTNYVPSSQVNTIFQSTAVNIIDFFIVILGLFMGYFTFGKDKTSGIIESVLKRPITKTKLITSRYLASALVIIAGVFLSMAISDLIFQLESHEHLTLIYVISESFALAGVGIIFLGISYLIASVVRSQGALLGFTFLIYFIFGLFASTIIELASLFSSRFYSTYFLLSYFFPSSLPSYPYILIQNKISFILSPVSGNLPTPASVGLTLPYVIIDAILWIAIPIFLAIIISNRAD